MNEYQRTEKYTNRRIKQLKGELSSVEPLALDAKMERYTSRRLFELRCEAKERENTFLVDNVLFRGYTMATMEVYRGD